MNLNRYETVKLSELVELHTGYQLRDTVDPDPEGKIKFIQIRDLDRETSQANLNSSDTITIEKSIDYEKYRLQEQDAIFLSKGSKPGAFLVPETEKWSDKGYHVIPMSHFLVLRCNPKRVIPSYLVWVLNQKFMEPTIKSAMKGSGIPFISRVDIAEFKIPLPTLEVQKRISELYELRNRERILVRKREDLVDQLVQHVLAGQLDNDRNTTAEAINFLNELRKI